MLSRTDPTERRLMLRHLASCCTSSIVFYGDSLIHYWEREGKQAWNTYLGALNITPFGIEGDTTGDLKQRFEDGELNLKKAPSAVMLLIGTNNTTANWGKEPVGKTLEGIKELADMILSKFPDTHLYIQKIFPRGRAIKNAVRNKGKQINTVLETWTLPRTTILSHGELFLREDGSMDPRLTTDYIHLSPAGYEIWAKAIRDVFISPL